MASIHGEEGKEGRRGKIVARDSIQTSQTEAGNEWEVDVS